MLQTKHLKDNFEQIVQRRGVAPKKKSKLPFEMSNLYHAYETHAILAMMLHRAAKQG